MSTKKLIKALGLIIVVALLAAALPQQAKAQEEPPQTLNVAQWTGPTNTGITGRETVLKVDGTYHMWYSNATETELTHAFSENPDFHDAKTEPCTFEDGAPIGVGSVSVIKDGGSFFMIAYGADEQEFAIYKSSDGNRWGYSNIVLDLFGTEITKIDGPYLFKDDATYRLFFQGKINGEIYAIFEAKSANIDGPYTFTPEPVLLSVDPNEWDGGFVMHPWVVKADKTYYLWYSAHNGTDPQRIGMAKSEDGINWVKSPGNPIITSSTGAEPSVLYDGTVWRMWYTTGYPDYITYYYEAAGPFEFSSIQAAIDAASEGDTINVAPGEYEGFKVVDKTKLTITGAGSGQTIIAPTALISTGKAHKSTSNMLASVFVDSSSGILLQGMTIKSTSDTPGSGGADAIVFWNASTGEIKDSIIQGIYTINGVQSGQGIAVDAGTGETATLSVTNTNISGFQKNAIDIVNGNGATSGGGAITVDVTGGTITGAGPTAVIAQNGIMFWNRAGGDLNGAISGVTLTGFNYTPTSDEATGFLNYGSGTGTLSITGCNFSSNEVHVYDNESRLDIDAIVAANTFDKAAYIEDGNVVYSSIQAAINAASTGDTIFIHAGTYVENPVLNATLNPNKQLNFIGEVDAEGKPLPLIKGTLSIDLPFADNNWSIENIKFRINDDVSPANHALILKNVNGLTIKNCEFDGAGLFASGKNGINIESGPNGNNLTVEDSVFKNGLYVGINGYVNSLAVNNCSFVDVKSGVNIQGGGFNTVTVENSNFSVIAQSASNDTYGVRFASSGANTGGNLTITNSSFVVDKAGFDADPGTYHSAIIVREGATGALKVENSSILGEVVNLTTSNTLDASPNWWGSVAGPAEGAVYGAVTYAPWCGDADCLTSMPNDEGVIDLTPPEGEDPPAPEEIQTAINNAPSGSTIVIPDGEYHQEGAFEISTPNLTIKLSDGTVIQNSSPCFVVTEDNVTITSETLGGGKCVPTDTGGIGDHGIVVNDGVQGLRVVGLEIDGTGQTTGDGIHFNGAASGVYLVSNSIHDLDGDAIEFTTTPTGSVTIEFNRFYNNGGNGLTIPSGAQISAINNWWGCNAGPGNSGCDTASGGVDYDPWLVLKITSEKQIVEPTKPIQIDADLIHNSDEENTLSDGYVPDGIEAEFAVQPTGVVNPDYTTTIQGQVSTMFNSTGGGVFNVCVAVDNQTVCTEDIVVPAAAAVDDVYRMMFNSTLDVAIAEGVTKNDTGITDFAYVVSLVSGPTHGQLELKPDGSFKYIPEANFLGEDVFIYQLVIYPREPAPLNNQNPWTDQATVTISVEAYQIFMPLILK